MDQITSTKENIIFGPFLLNEKKGGVGGTIVTHTPDHCHRDTPH